MTRTQSCEKDRLCKIEYVAGLGHRQHDSQCLLEVCLQHATARLRMRHFVALLQPNAAAGLVGAQLCVSWKEPLGVWRQPSF